MYTVQEIANLMDLYEQQRVAGEKLESFCTKVAIALDYKYVTNCYITENNEVHFRAEWEGSYQAHDHEDFYFPARMLVNGEERVIDYFKQLREKEKEEARAKNRILLEENERRELARLKEKYG